MLRIRYIHFFLYSLLIFFGGMQSAYCHQLSFKEGAAGSYIVSQHNEQITKIKALNNTIYYESDIELALDIKILSSEKITHWFSRPTHVFQVEVLIKNVLLSCNQEDEEQNTSTIQYNSATDVFGNDPVEQELYGLIGVPLHFQIDDKQVKETTMHLSTFDHSCKLSTRWENCELLSVLEGFIEELFDLSGETVSLGQSYSLPACYSREVLKKGKCKTASEYKTYKICTIDSAKTTATCTAIFQGKASIEDVVVDVDITANTNVTWDNENSLLQTRDTKTEIFLDSEFFYRRCLVQDLWLVDSPPQSN